MKYDFAGWATRNNIRCSDGSAGHLHAWIENNTIKYDTDWYGSLVIHPD